MKGTGPVLTTAQRITLAAVITAILVGPIAMLFLALSAHGHKPATPPSPPVPTVRVVSA